MKRLTPFAITFFVLLLVAAFVILKAFNFRTENPPKTDTVKTELKTGLNQKVDGWKISITPISIIEDSRCPVDVTCIQAGTTRVLAKITVETGEKEYVLPLDVPVSVDSRMVTLIRVTPAPRSQYQILATEYRFTFQVSEKGEF
ncbi:MAG: hypothetical protein U1D31_00170 [Patescibacteria group bacterium]|nr:hypothetical protein [bacterium]MDZ4240535.1 hypothetical protein [Patescibacteria group bacterium]